MQKVLERNETPLLSPNSIRFTRWQRVDIRSLCHELIRKTHLKNSKATKSDDEQTCLKRAKEHEDPTYLVISDGLLNQGIEDVIVPAPSASPQPRLDLA